MSYSQRNWSRREILALGSSAALAACAPWRVGGAEAPLYIDGLTFLPDDPRDLSRSGLDAFICDVSRVEETTDKHGRIRYLRTFSSCNEGLNAALRRIENEFPDARVLTRGSEITPDGATGLLLQFQSCEPIGDDLDRIGYFHGKGLRVLQLTHHHDNLFAGGALEPEPSGLTPLGRQGISEMNRLSMVIDVSHASEPTILEAAAASKNPIVLSHGACRALVDNPRCASDAAIRAVAESGGAMGIFMMSFWLTTESRPTVEHYVEQVRHVVNVGGIDAAAIANDYPIAGHEYLKSLGNDNTQGVKGYYDWWRSIRARGVPGYETLPQHVVVPELNDVHRMYSIEQALGRRGFKPAEVEKIMGGNWRRVLTTILG